MISRLDVRLARFNALDCKFLFLTILLLNDNLGKNPKIDVRLHIFNISDSKGF